MARQRRKARASLRWNLEIVGLAAFGAALFLGVCIVAPDRSGAAGAAIARGAAVAFGNAAWLVPPVVALFGAIVFLEINVPRLIAKFGTAALACFALVDAVYGRAGGAVGTMLDRALHAAVGGIGSRVVLVIAALALTVWIANVSVKRTIGRAFVLVMALRARFARSAPRARAAAPAKSPRTLGEAFGWAPALGAAAGIGTAIVPVRTGRTPAAAVDDPADGDALAEDEGDDETEADDEELDDEDEELDDEDEELDDEEDDEEEVVRPAAPARRAVAGEYLAAPQPASDGSRRSYRLPDLALFDPPQHAVYDETQRSALLEDTLSSFGVGAKVTHIERGPAITRYELKPERGVKISRISSLADDIALALAATSVRIEAPIPGKSAVGIEVPNAHVSVVAISEILQALPSRGQIPPLNMALGKDITGRPVFGDLGKMPHLLVAGATGSGKSVCLNCIIASLLVSATPDQVQMLFIDPKRVELTVYNGIPHLIKDVITDPRLAAGALFEMTREMDSRYERFAKAGVRKIEEYNAKFSEEKLPYVVIVIDELADLMMIAPAKVETTICRLAQLARATGIHLVVATQRPSVDVITGIIKANIPSRIAFAVSSQVDSRTILDMAGAERLLGRGDMLYLPIDAPKPVRSQGALITGPEVSRLVAFWAAQGRPDNLLDVDVAPIEEDDRGRAVDPLAYEAAKFIIETNYASTAQLQSQFAVGHPRAVR
ncbi:MAG: DNA translocase FtsK 4TM domain-containing protein, partial [Candidatus Eremiobacteraeota bacterium]|nr:DNA translocase FtsK 4TM domain-containing protein [Candidatus Eremiobacteraeota bacterium]